MDAGCWRGWVRSVLLAGMAAGLAGAGIMVMTSQRAVRLPEASSITSARGAREAAGMTEIAINELRTDLATEAASVEGMRITIKELEEETARAKEALLRHEKAAADLATEQEMFTKEWLAFEKEELSPHNAEVKRFDALAAKDKDPATGEKLAKTGAALGRKLEVFRDRENDLQKRKAAVEAEKAALEAAGKVRTERLKKAEATLEKAGAAARRAYAQLVAVAAYAEELKGLCAKYQVEVSKDYSDAVAGAAEAMKRYEKVYGKGATTRGGN